MIFTRVGKGGNSRTSITNIGGKKLFAKFYFGDDRTRLHQEYSSLLFLHTHGIHSVPKPHSVDTNHNIAYYEYIAGIPITPHAVTKRDIQSACDFLSELITLRKSNDSRQLTEAKEACFHTSGIVYSIQKRLDLLGNLVPQGEALRNFNKDFLEVFEKVILWSKKILIQHQIKFDKPLGRMYWILSPSDFGFHNAIRRPGGEVSFVDFEYFGWDDPVKLISDFLLHPKNTIKPKLKQQFLKTMLQILDEDDLLPIRIRAEYPLFGLKWCLIMLNEFIPEEFNRRETAYGRNMNREIILKRQLSKSKKMLTFVSKTYDNFPYDL